MVQLSKRAFRMAKIHFLSNINEEFFQNENAPEQKPRYLYKTMPLENFLKTAKTGLWFAKPSTWQDPFEKRFYTAERFIIKGKKKINPLKDKFLCCCMTSIVQSEAHWNIYSRDQIGIQLIINREKLLSFLKGLPAHYQFFIGKAEYQQEPEIMGKLIDNDFLGKNFKYQKKEDLTKLLLLKRIPFKYEDEVRFIVWNNGKKYKKNGISIKGKGKTFIDTIHSIKISPDCPKEMALFLKKYIKQDLAVDIDVCQSHLLDEKKDKRIITIK